MDPSVLKRLVRLLIGLLVLAGPAIAFLSTQASYPPRTATSSRAGGNVAFAQIIETDTPTPTFTPTPSNTPTNTPTPTASVTPSRTPSPTAQPTALYADAYEPNNDFTSAYSALVGAPMLCNITLWPTGDVDFFKFVGKTGLAYEVLTDNLDPGLDTHLTLYDPQGNVIGVNDDYEFGNRGSRLVFSAQVEGLYFGRVVNQEVSDPSNRKYCFDVNEIQGTATPTPAPTGTRVPGADACEDNGSVGTACLVGPDQTYQMNFVPLVGNGPDNDFYRMWIKAGLFYTCETLNLSSVNDTNMILYDQNGNPFSPPIGNDDKAPGDFGSRVSYFSTYTGWLHILVGPHAVPDYGLSHLYTYDLRCEQLVATPTRTPTATRPPAAPGQGGGFPAPATPTPQFPPTSPAVPTPPVTPTATARPNVVIQPLPTGTPAGGGQRLVSLSVTLYYDANLNFTPELNEGITDVAVALYDNASNQLLAFGSTNEAGMIRFDDIATSGPIRVSVPFLNFSQVVASVSSNIIIRVAPRPLPIGIP